MDVGLSPLSGPNRATRSRRHSPLYPPTPRRSSPGEESKATFSRTTKPTTLSIRNVEDDDDSDDDMEPPKLSDLAMAMMNEKPMENGNQPEPPRTGRKLQFAETPAVRTIERRSPTSGSSTESHRSLSPYSSRPNDNEPVTPAPRTRSRIGMTLTTPYDASEQKETDGDRSYYSAARPSTITTSTPAARWKRSSALVGAPRRVLRRDSSYTDHYEGNASGISPVEREDEPPPEPEPEPEPEMEREEESPALAGYRIKSRESISGSYRRRISPNHSNEINAEPVRSRESISGSYGRMISPNHSNEYKMEMDPPRAPSPIQQHPIRPSRDPSPIERYPARDPSPIHQYPPRMESPEPIPKEQSTVPLQAYVPSLPVYNKENVAPAVSARQAAYRPQARNDDRNMLANSPSRKRPTQVPSLDDRPVDKPVVLANRTDNTPLRPAPPPPPPKMSPIEAATNSNTSQMTNSNGTSRRGKGEMKVNNRTYQRLMLLGKGGSSRVYKVMTDAGKFFALKKVTFHKEDGEAAIAGYKGEIQLLNKLAHVERVIKLWDSEINDRKQCLLMLMECGETDLAKLLSEKNCAKDARLDIHFVRYYWKEMLECVKAVHEVNIIHSDLKPANFLLVQGRLKLIDFGIANAIQDDTVNVHRESQVGTVNYMAPETLQDVGRQSGRGGAKLHKLGAPSDVWSLGCILYQMIYGKTPFAHVTSIFDKVKAITNPEYPVEYPLTGIGGVPVPRSAIQCMKACLRREKERRPTIIELLSYEDRFMNPDLAVDNMVDISADNLASVLKNLAQHCKVNGLPSEEDLEKSALRTFSRLQHQMFEGRGGSYSR